MRLKARKAHYLPVALTILLLTGLGAQTLSLPTARDAEPYHRRVREAAASLPMSVDEWVGSDIPVPAAAVSLLRPNVLLHRRFTSKSNGETADFLLVHCRDARDMAGHYPPVCYPAHGWVEAGRRQVEWNIDGKVIPGMSYQYTRVFEGKSVTYEVNHLMMLPDGRFVREMRDIRRAAADHQRQFYGAGQVQVVLSTHIPQEQRTAIVCKLLQANQAVLAAMGSGGGQ